jgi:hypothetical protein
MGLWPKTSVHERETTVRTLCLLAGALSALIIPSSALAGFEVAAGWEGDATRGYLFLAPAWAFDSSSAGGLVLRAVASRLHYPTVEEGLETQVSSSGGALELSYRFHLGSLAVAAGPGFEVRREVSSNVEGKFPEWTRGPTLAMDLSLPTDSLTNLILTGSYTHASRFVWVRAGVEEQITNRAGRGPLALSIGLELTGQGNDEIHSYDSGAVLELADANLGVTLRLRGGTSRLWLGDERERFTGYLGLDFHVTLSGLESD